ncbi:MAG: outer membrane beta-barrel protein [Cruoricaptor ignavus]|nr:outer membrane beta-barrel protein [Cruoricaptor ignavus]
MKKLLLLSFIAIFGLSNAQIKFGVNAGLATNFANLKADKYKTKDNHSGFYAGVFSEIGVPLLPLKIQPAVNYVHITDAHSYIQVPVMLKYYFIPKLNFQAGPQIAFMLDGIASSSSINRTNFGLGFGFGADIIAGLMAEARYAVQLNNTFKSPADGEKLHFNILNIGVGYKF